MVVETQWVADRAHPLAHAQEVGVPERDGGVLAIISRLHLQESEVGLGVASHDGRPNRPRIDERHLDAFSTIDNVVIRQQVAFMVDKEARARASPRQLQTLMRIAERIERISR